MSLNIGASSIVTHVVTNTANEPVNGSTDYCTARFLASVKSCVGEC